MPDVGRLQMTTHRTVHKPIPAKAQEAHRLRAEGHTLAETGRRIGLTRQGVWRLLRLWYTTTNEETRG